MNLSYLLSIIFLCVLITIFTLQSLTISSSSFTSSFNSENHHNNNNNNNKQTNNRNWNNLRKSFNSYQSNNSSSLKFETNRKNDFSTSSSSLSLIDNSRSSENKKSDNLHPNWSNLILHASNKITFQIMKVSLPDINLNIRFWYPVEETLHSANYIQSNELVDVSYWIQTIQSTREALGSCNVMDIGSNGGYFTLLSRSINCNVIAVDPQPWCLTRLSSGAAINGFTDQITTKWTAVSSDSNLTITVGSNKCSGLWSVTGSDWINKESTSTVEVSSSTLQQIVEEWLPNSNEIINIIKIDAEGSEISVISSGLSLFQSHRILNILWEIVPGRVKEITSFSIVNQTFASLYQYGYYCYRDITQSNPLSLAYILHYFDPKIKIKDGRNAPQMWRCSFGQSEGLKLTPIRSE